MSFARDTYTSAGEATYTITFPYLAAGHVNLFVDGVSKTYTLDDSTTLRPVVAVTSGQIVLITRTSNQTARLVDYVDASVFKAATLDADLLQAFYISQEALDGSTLRLGLASDGVDWDATSKKIENLTAGSVTGDATEYDQVVNLIGAAGGVPANTVAGNLLSSSATIPEWATNRAAYSLTDATATSAIGPDLVLDRNSASPADADVLGGVTFKGRNDNATPQEVTYARAKATILDASDGTEDGSLEISTMVAGVSTLAGTFELGGLAIGSTGGLGAGKLNADSVWDNGVQLLTPAVEHATANAWSAAQKGTHVELTDATTVAVDFALANNFYVTVTADRTIGAPSNVVQGQAGFIVVEQDGTGGWTTSWNAAWLFKDAVAPAAGEVIGDKAVIAYYVDWDSEIHCTFIGDF